MAAEVPNNRGSFLYIYSVLYIYFIVYFYIYVLCEIPVNKLSSKADFTATSNKVLYCIVYDYSFQAKKNFDLVVTHGDQI